MPKRENVPPPDSSDLPLAAWFLGPRAENAPVWLELLTHIFADHVHWRRNYFPTDPVVVGRSSRRSPAHEAWLDHLSVHLESILNELKGHFPFHSPRYLAHMLSEQSLPSVLGLFAGQLYNPNNVTDEAAPITVSLELEVGRMIASMLGYNPRRAWAHLCSGGTVANLEALWVARSTQFVPFMVRDYCTAKALKFTIKLPNQPASAGITDTPIADVPDAQLLSLRPNEAIFMLRKLVRFETQTTQRPAAQVLTDINRHIHESPFNVAQRGMAPILTCLGKTPVLFASASAHYSIAKAANVLGYGERAVRLVPVDDRFRMDADALGRLLAGLPESEYIAAVVGVVGSTEEGAVDPIHKIRFARDRYEQSMNRSFWLHVDAAWGGYLRTLFNGLGIRRAHSGTPLPAICAQYARALQVTERVEVEFGLERQERKVIHLWWKDENVYSALLAMADADSTTIDPHKMGFVPYPAGVVAFRNGLVTELLAQRAQYISTDEGGVKGGIDEPNPIDAVGPYILEGSKPGAAALSCWLAHKCIPLDVHGHGKIVRTTLLNAKKLWAYIVNHQYMFRRIQHAATGSPECIHPFTFMPFSEPDSNVVCFMARPMAWQSQRLVAIDFPLFWINALNQRIYDESSISSTRAATTVTSSQPFFLSRTRFEERQYTAASIAPVLSRNSIVVDEYRRHGVFVLRSAVMNPWHFAAARAGFDYLMEFLIYLHKTTARLLPGILKDMEGAGASRTSGPAAPQ